MDKKTKNKKVNVDGNFLGKIQIFLRAALVCLCAIFVILLLYYFDNKYTATQPLEKDGIAHINEKTLEKERLIFLVHGWEYYDGKLLSPDTVGKNFSDERIYIGQYGGFEAGDLSKSPHGSASYKMNIALPKKEKNYSISLPEIFSSYKIYINGEMLGQMGETEKESYKPETGEKTISFKANEKVEILVAVSDYSHFYSGMVYPPAFGEEINIKKLDNAQMIFRSLITSFVLAIGLIAFLYGILTKKRKQTVLYGLLCIFFVGYTSYPIVKSLFSGFYPFYIVEMFSFCAMLLTVMLIQRTFYKSKYSKLFIGFGFFMCAFSLVIPIFIAYGNLFLMGIYSNAIASYEYLTAAYLIWSFGKAVYKQKKYSKILLYGVLIFTTTLIMDRILVHYEPILTAWFPELSSFILVVCVGIAVVKETADNYKEGIIMESLLKIQRSSYDLLKEQIRTVKIARHDLRHHIIMIESLLKSEEYEKLESYLREMQSSATYNNPLTYSKNAIIDAIAKQYVGIACEEGIGISLDLKTKAEIEVSEVDLCVVLSNLLENAIEACKNQKNGEKFIDLEVRQSADSISIIMKNSTGKNLHQDEYGYFSSKGERRRGYGLKSIKSVAKKYKGYSEFKYDKEENLFLSLVVMLEEKEQ